MSRVNATIMEVTGLLDAGEFARAQQVLQKTLQRLPQSPELNNAMAIVLLKLKDYERGMYFAARACALAPNQPTLLNSLGGLQALSEKNEEAIRTFEKALALDPSNNNARIGIANALCAVGRPAAAVDHARIGLLHNPEDVGMIVRLCSASFAAGDAPPVVEWATQCLRRFPEQRNAAVGLSFALNYVDGVSREEIFRAHRLVGELTEKLIDAEGGVLPPAPNSREPDRRLKIALVSADFKEHSVSYFLEAIMKHLDRAGYELWCYSACEKPDARTRYLESLADRWADVATLDNDTLARRIREDGIDVAFELAGHTEGQKLPCFAFRPAPVQVTYCGYPNTTGLTAIGYRLVDSLTDPPGAERFHTEKLVRLDPCFLCYTPLPEAPEPAAPAFESRAGQVSFGSFNTLLKVTDRVVQTWARLVQAVPGSRLVLKGTQIVGAEGRERFAARLRAAGLRDEQFHLLTHAKSQAEHLALYREVDIALDPFPYNGTTTTCEAAWMGLPTVTLEGDSHAGRVGVSLLTAMGLSDLVARDTDEYVKLAAALAADKDRLRDLRRNLRDRLRQGPLCDAPAFAQRFGAAVRMMWREWCAGGGR